MFELFISIIALFLGGLAAKSLFPGLCALCFATAGTWLLGLSVFVFSLEASLGIQEIDPVMLAVLMGGSAVGLLYYLSARLPEQYGFFKLPFLLTLFWLVYLMLAHEHMFGAAILVAGVWAVFIGMFSLKDTHTRQWVTKIIACCRDW
ncbi:MAG: hypothetical protein WDZ82_01255 [Candidatus Paceibacterota bacterium]